MRSRRRPATAEPAIDPRQLLSLLSAHDVEAMIDAAFQFLKAAVGCDFVTAFYRSTGDGLLKQRDSRGRESDPAFMRRYMELTPALPAAMANPGVKILTTRAVMPLSDSQLHTTAFYQEIMRPEGWRHAAALCFWGDPLPETPIFVTSVYRGEGQKDFSNRDIASLERVYPFLDCAVDRLHEREAATTVRDGMAMATHDGARGFAILDRNLVLVQASPAARRFSVAWARDGDAAEPGREDATWHLPPVLAAECHELHSEWRTLVRANPNAADVRPHRRLSHARIPGLEASVTIVCSSAAGLGQPTFVVEFERREASVLRDTQTASVLQAMTATERGVATALADGLSNQQIADQLGKSVAAVKFLLHRIYQKTGVPGRAALVAAVLRALRDI